jgi:hypothetical protein
VAVVVASADEHRHHRGPEPLWAESWYFDFSTADASLGGFARLALYPNLGVAWYWAALVGHGRRLVLVRDDEIELPRGGQLEVRGQGLWSSVNCETPLDHWSVGLEAFAVALDDPTEAFRGERGDLVGVGFDLEWESVAPAVSVFGPGQYGQACRVSGEILVGDEQLEFDGVGHRRHRWGVQDWWGSFGDVGRWPGSAREVGSRPGSAGDVGSRPGSTGGRCQASGILGGGAAFEVRAGDVSPAIGYLSSESRSQLLTDGVGVAGTLSVGGLLESVTVDLGPLRFDASILAPAPLLLQSPEGRRAQLATALCLYRSTDGRHGVGWASQLRTTA